jgi:hypothetical protein
MRTLTNEEIATRDRRRTDFDRFFEEGIDVLGEFMQLLGLPNPYMVVNEAEKYLTPVSDWIKDRVVEPQDRILMLTRIAYFIGELINQRFGGCWYLDEDPESPYFLQYVVGQFTKLGGNNSSVAPFPLANYFVNQAQGRDLAKLIADVEAEILRS